MDRFKLVVCQCDGNERWQIGIVEKFFPCRQAGFDFIRRGRNKQCRFRRATRLGNPVLNFAEFTPFGIVSPNVGHQLFVQLPDEPDADRQFLEACDVVFQGDHIIAHFPQIIGAAFHSDARFGSALRK